jgi:hypothetical protein
VDLRDDTVGGIAVDASGRLHVAFYETPTETLKYATRGNEGGGKKGGGRGRKCQGEQCARDPELTTAAQVPGQPDIEAICTRLAAGVNDKCEVQGFEASPASLRFSQAQRAGKARRLTKKVRQRFDKDATATTPFRVRLNSFGRKLLATTTAGDPLNVALSFRVKSAGKESVFRLKLVGMVRGGLQ